MMTEEKSLEQLLGPDFAAELAPRLDKLEAPPTPKPPCSFCHKIEGVYALEKVELILRTSEGATHMIASTSNNHILCCVADKNSANDEYIAVGCHLSIMQETNVQSELDDYNVYWRML